MTAAICLVMACVSSFTVRVASDGVREPEPVVAAAEARPSVLGPRPWSGERADFGELVLGPAGWPEWLWDDATRVVYGPTWRCPNGESTGHPWARNGRYLGLFQLDLYWFGYYGFDVAAWDDPATNAAVAWLLHEDAGWSPWDCRP